VRKMRLKMSDGTGSKAHWHDVLSKKHTQRTNGARGARGVARGKSNRGRPSGGDGTSKRPSLAKLARLTKTWKRSRQGFKT